MMPRPGTTLLEVIVTMALLALIASVATPAIRASSRVDPGDPARLVRDSLRIAILDRRAISWTVRSANQTIAVSVHPDAGVFVDGSLTIDPLTGAVTSAR